MAAPRSKEEQQQLLIQYAKAWQETGVAAEKWYNNVVADGKWSSAKRYISKKLAKAYLDGLSQLPTDSANKQKIAPDESAKKTKRSNKVAKNCGNLQDEPIESAKSCEKPKISCEKYAKKCEKQITSFSQNDKSSRNSHTHETPKNDLEANDDEALDEFFDDAPTQPTAPLLHSKKQSNRGGPREGAGAPLRNRNAVTHGIYCQILDEGDQELLDHAASLSIEEQVAQAKNLAMMKLLKTIARESDADQLEQMGDGEINHASLRHDSFEYSSNSNDEGSFSSEKWIKKRPDFDGIANQFMGRIQGLAMLHEKLREGHPLTKFERLKLRGVVLERFAKEEITAVEAGRLLEIQGIEVPPMLALEIKAQLAIPQIDEKESITVEELDRQFDEDQQTELEGEAWLNERRSQLSELQQTE